MGWPPLAPGVNVLANGAPTMQLNATADYTNTTPFKVELTQSWTNNEPVTVKFRYYLTNSTVAISSGCSPRRPSVKYFSSL